jgi:hypothetical protein
MLKKMNRTSAAVKERLQNYWGRTVKANIAAAVTAAGPRCAKFAALMNPSRRNIQHVSLYSCGHTGSLAHLKIALGVSFCPNSPQSG